ncbi:uncharacterized protein LOC144671645 isoform X1 [Cetorhinus maximus]
MPGIVSISVLIVFSGQLTPNNKLNSGAIAGIVIAVIILGLISGISAWLIKKKACGMKEPTQGQNATNISPRVNNYSIAIGENSAPTYENIPSLQKEQVTKPLEEDSTYMGLQQQDQSFYSSLYTVINDETRTS